jgi:hypothetical protein
MHVQIEPTPLPDEAAAIEAALRQVLGGAALKVRSLRYRDVMGNETLSLFQPLTWADAARLQSLDCGV